MKEWIAILVALVNNETSYDHGTRSENEMKVASSEAKIEIQSDARWNELVELGEIFGNS